MEATPISHTDSNLRRLAHGGLIIVCVALFGGVLLMIASRGKSSPPGPHAGAPSEESRSRISDAQFAYDSPPADPPRGEQSLRMIHEPRPPTMDDSGGQMVWFKFFAPNLKDPLSLEHIRDVYLQAPEIGIAAVQQE